MINDFDKKALVIFQISFQHLWGALDGVSRWVVSFGISVGTGMGLAYPWMVGFGISAGTGNGWAYMCMVGFEEYAGTDGRLGASEGLGGNGRQRNGGPAECESPIRVGMYFFIPG